MKSKNRHRVNQRFFNPNKAFHLIMFQRYSDFRNMQLRCLMTSSTPHRPNKLPQMRNISSNNCAHWNVSFVLAQLQSFSTIYLLFLQIFLFYGISGVDDIIRYLIFIFFKTKISLEQDEKLTKREIYSSLCNNVTSVCIFIGC